MKIDVSAPMVTAFQSGDDTYTPVFQGVELDLECGQPRVSLKNLKRILDAGDRHVVCFLLRNQQVLVILNTGETYLATGFQYGHKQDEVYQFALFAAKQGFGDEKELFQHLSNLPVDHCDVMTAPSHDDLISEAISSEESRPHRILIEPE